MLSPKMMAYYDAALFKSPITAAGLPPISTEGAPEPLIGPPTCGDPLGFVIGHTCMLPTVAAGPGIFFCFLGFFFFLVYFYEASCNFGYSTSRYFGLCPIYFCCCLPFNNGIHSFYSSIICCFYSHSSITFYIGITR